MAETRARANQKEANPRINEEAWESRFVALEERLAESVTRVKEMFDGFLVAQQAEGDQRAPLFPNPLDGAGETSDRRRTDRPSPANYYEALNRYHTSTTNGNQYYGDRSTETAMGYDETAREKTYNNLYGSMTKIDTVLPRFDEAKVKDWFKDTGDDPIAELKALQETEGIVEYHKKFEKIRMRVNLPEEYLVSVYLAGLRLGTQMHVRRFQPHCIRRCFELGQLYEMAYPIKGTGSVKNFPESQKWSKPDKSKGIENKSKVEEVLLVQRDITVESDSVSEQIKDVSVPFSGEERVCAAESSIQVVDETYAVPDEEINPREPLLLDNSWEVVKSGPTTEIQDLVHEDESHLVIGSDVKTYYSPQSQVLSSTLEPSHRIYKKPRGILKELSCFDVRKDEIQSSYDCDSGKTDAVQMFDQMSSVITSREKYMRHLKSWKFKFKAREQAIKVLWQYSLSGKKCVDLIMKFHGCWKLIINPLKLESSSIIDAAGGLIRFVASVNSHREFIAKSGASEEIIIASEFSFEIFKRTQSRVYVHERLSSSGQIVEREYKVLKLLDSKGCSQDSKVVVKEKDPHDAFVLIIDGKTTLATAVVEGSELKVDYRVWDPGGFQLQEISIEKLKGNKVSVAYQVHEVSLQTSRSRFFKGGGFDTVCLEEDNDVARPLEFVTRC